MKYFFYVKNKLFTQALASLEPELRYITAKRRWYAARLGLYRSLLENMPSLYLTKRRHILVYIIANIKRQNLSDKEAIAAIEYVLSHKRYHQFYNELIKEVAPLYPEVIFDFLRARSDDLGSPYYQGLYIALLQKYYPLGSSIKNHLGGFLSSESDDDYADKKCLYNNIVLNTPLIKLANLNQVFNHHQLDQIALTEEQQFKVTNLRALEQLDEYQRLGGSNPLHKVTVLVTTYNASETIDSCINSLRQQTWQNLEVIVVDDASTDDTLLRLQYIGDQNIDVKIISLPHNVGTFAAKSIGAQYATGEFLTCQDSDDWAHPQKIAEQVQPLIEDPNIIATTSYWLRLDQYGQYYVRQIYPFMRQNPASPMFRLQTVKQQIGLWHIVRTGADSEFFERLKLVFGKERIKVIKKPLTIASHRPNSLMTSEEFGIYNHTAALARLDYWETWRLWHIDTLYQKVCLVMPSVQQQANASQDLFVDIPVSINVDKLSLKNSLFAHKLLSNSQSVI